MFRGTDLGAKSAAPHRQQQRPPSQPHKANDRVPSADNATVAGLSRALRPRLAEPQYAPPERGQRAYSEMEGVESNLLVRHVGEVKKQMDLLADPADLWGHQTLMLISPSPSSLRWDANTECKRQCFTRHKLLSWRRGVRGNLRSTPFQGLAGCTITDSYAAKVE